MEKCSGNNYNRKWRGGGRGGVVGGFLELSLNNRRAVKSVDGTALHTVVGHVVVVVLVVVGASRKKFQTCLQTQKTKTKGAVDDGSDGASMFREKQVLEFCFLR